MKLLRYGPVGQEKPGLLDDTGRVRDLSAHVDDIAGSVLLPEGLGRLAALDPATLPQKAGCHESDLLDAVAKELIDNALDEAGAATFDATAEGWRNDRADSAASPPL